MLKQTITIQNKLGLHARAAAKFVNHAGRFASNIQVVKNGQSVNGKSIMGVMMLAASKGTELEFIVEGEDADDMMSDLVELVKDNFGEEE